MGDWAIERYTGEGSGPRLGVKDLIDIEGTVTSAGSRVVHSKAKVATKDSVVISRARGAGARIVAKTNLTELAFGATGINPWFGTPTNPFNATLIPGGSSSGSAVGVAVGELDCAFASDTGGSIRIPSACCGVFGLKTTFGRVPLAGVWPLAPSLDTVGPIAASAENLELAMGLLEPGFSASAPFRPSVALVRGSGDAQLLDGIGKVMALVSESVSMVDDPGLVGAWDAGMRIMFCEAMAANSQLLPEAHRLDPAVMARFEVASKYGVEDLAVAALTRTAFSQILEDLLSLYDFLILPTLRVEVPSLRAAYGVQLNANTVPFNLAGLPSLAMPVTISPSLAAELDIDRRWAEGIMSSHVSIPWSIQVVGRHNSEPELVTIAKSLQSILRQI